ncbi:conserved hypothetical protein [uncultured Mycobacterium sp.]|uniref:Uncharacterized protein n=1 Tax=uncultured Mycobacterium sp. TaxID=171292 RepID=A0A1Y5PK54_9MYCO|nr:conserved hypothetical protein [uncultured Mycobacterium sp.]
MRPFHEAMCRRARRARHSWQVFGLTGAHQFSMLLLAVASQPRKYLCEPVLMELVKNFV